jgi:hypothetical protein
MPKYYRFLNLKANFFDQAALTSELSKTLKDPNANQQWRNWGENPDVFTTEAYRWLELFNCDIGTAEAFYTAPKKALGWHTDVSGKSPIVDYVKINFIWGATHSHAMEWGALRSGVAEPTIQYNLVGSPYMPFDPSTIDIVEKVCINKPILINVGVPHRVINQSNYGRWCLCLIPKKQGMRLLFDEAVELFSEYVVD